MENQNCPCCPHTSGGVGHQSNNPCIVKKRSINVAGWELQAGATPRTVKRVDGFYFDQSALLTLMGAPNPTTSAILQYSVSVMAVDTEAEVKTTLGENIIRTGKGGFVIRYDGDYDTGERIYPEGIGAVDYRLNTDEPLELFLAECTLIRLTITYEDCSNLVEVPPVLDFCGCPVDADGNLVLDLNFFNLGGGNPAGVPPLGFFLAGYDGTATIDINLLTFKNKTTGATVPIYAAPIQPGAGNNPDTTPLYIGAQDANIGTYELTGTDTDGNAIKSDFVIEIGLNGNKLRAFLGTNLRKFFPLSAANCESITLSEWFDIWSTVDLDADGNPPLLVVEQGLSSITITGTTDAGQTPLSTTVTFSAVCGEVVEPPMFCTSAIAGIGAGNQAIKMTLPDTPNPDDPTTPHNWVWQLPYPTAIQIECGGSVTVWPYVLNTSTEPAQINFVGIQLPQACEGQTATITFIGSVTAMNAVTTETCVADISPIVIPIL